MNDRRLAASALPALTGARFFAALVVVLCHYGLEAVSALSPWFADVSRAGPCAVSFFYVLSGTVLTWGCTAPSGLPVRDARTFWWQRAARIAPAYLFALLLSLLPFVSHVLKLHPGMAGWLRAMLGLAVTAFALQSFWPPLVGLNTPGWSISCEAFFYALWPRLVGPLRSSAAGIPWRRALLLCVGAFLTPALALLALSAKAVPNGPFPTLLEDASGAELLAEWVTYFPPFRLCEFALGIVLGHALRNAPPPAETSARDNVAESALLLALLACMTLLGGGVGARLIGIAIGDRIFIESGTLAPLFALLIWQLARGRGWLQRVLSLPALIALGEASYGLYVLQEPVVVWFSAFLKRVAPALSTRWDLMFWPYLAVLVLLSLALHRFVEMPLRSWLLARLRNQR